MEILRGWEISSGSRYHRLGGPSRSSSLASAALRRNWSSRPPEMVLLSALMVSKSWCHFARTGLVASEQVMQFLRFRIAVRVDYLRL